MPVVGGAEAVNPQALNATAVDRPSANGGNAEREQEVGGRESQRGATAPEATTQPGQERGDESQPGRRVDIAV